MDKFTVIKDTREKTGWTFRKTDYCAGTIVEKIDFGDYAIQGLENRMFIERKASVVEFAKNVTEPRFTRLLENAEHLKYKFIIFECPLQEFLDWPYGSGLNKSLAKKMRVTTAFMLSRLFSMSVKHGIIPVYCANKSEAQKYTLSLLKYIYKKECKTGPSA